MKEKKREKGFSLLEVIVSMLILSIVVPGTFCLIVTSNSSLEESKQRLQAVNQALAVIERLRYYVSSDPADPVFAGRALADGTDYSPVIVGLRATPSVESDSMATWNYDVTSMTDTNCKRVDVAVNW